jgi:hypothetical protein
VIIGGALSGIEESHSNCFVKLKWYINRTFTTASTETREVAEFNLNNFEVSEYRHARQNCP